MAETVKKAKTAKSKTPAQPVKKSVTPDSTPKNGKQTTIPHDQVAMLAHRFWAERGRQHGHHEEDWFRAEQELRARAS